MKRAFRSPDFFRGFIEIPRKNMCPSFLMFDLEMVSPGLSHLVPKKSDRNID